MPDEWQLLWAGPETPSVYIEEFCYRARAAHDRVQSYEHSNDYMPKGKTPRTIYSVGQRLNVYVNIVCDIFLYITLALYYNASFNTRQI